MERVSETKTQSIRGRKTDTQRGEFTPENCPKKPPPHTRDGHSEWFFFRLFFPPSSKRATNQPTEQPSRVLHGCNQGCGPFLVPTVASQSASVRPVSATIRHRAKAGREGERVSESRERVQRAASVAHEVSLVRFIFGLPNTDDDDDDDEDSR